MTDNEIKDISDQVDRLRRRTRWTVGGFLAFVIIGSGAANVDRGMLHRTLTDVTDAYLVARDPGATGVIASWVGNYGLFRPDNVGPVRDINRVRRGPAERRPGALASAADPVDVANPLAAEPAAPVAPPAPVTLAEAPLTSEPVTDPGVGPSVPPVAIPPLPGIIGLPGILTPVPEPATWLVMVLGFLGLGGAMRLRLRRGAVTQA